MDSGPAEIPLGPGLILVRDAPLFHSGAFQIRFLPGLLLSRCGTIFLRVWSRMTSMAAMKLAVEHVRRMRGGAQAHLMRCDDEAYYVVKFQDNPSI
jgi:hypothetical protein